MRRTTLDPNHGPWSYRLTPRIASSANVTLMVPSVLTILRRLIVEPRGFRGSLDGRDCGRVGPLIAEPSTGPVNGAAVGAAPGGS